MLSVSEDGGIVLKKYAIIGFGCAGYNAARAIRQYDADGQIDVFDVSALPPFNPMLTTYYVSDRIPLEAAFPFGTLDEVCGALRLNFIAETVTRLDAAAKTVCTGDGAERVYDRVLISTGAQALVPRFLQVSGDRYFLMRTQADAERLRQYLDGHAVHSAAVVGGSMVGIKVAELLYKRAVDTTIIDAAPYIFPLAAYESTARKIHERLEDAGVKLLFDAKVSAISEEGVTLADGRLISADIVCLCIGTRPNLDLLNGSDDVKVNRAIVVDTHMETSAPGVYAAGDCCEGLNMQTGKTAIIGLWANAGAQGSCAGANMAGVPTWFGGNILHNITHFFDMDFIGLGDISLPGEKHSFFGEDFSIEVVMDGGELKSVNLFGNYKISGILKNHLIKRLNSSAAKLSPAQRGLLARYGVPEAFIDLIGGEV